MIRKSVSGYGAASTTTSRDDDTVSLILSLLDQPYDVRRAMRGLQQAIDAALPDARQAILEKLKEAS